jgi:hypothetical protein
MSTDRIKVETLFTRTPILAFSISPIIEQKDREVLPEQQAEIVQPVDDVSGVAMTPDKDRTIRLRLHVPAEELRAIRRLKPDVFKRKPARGTPVFFMPALGMKDKELIEDVPGQHADRNLTDLGASREADAWSS